MIALLTSEKKTFPSQLDKAIGRKFDGSLVGPDLWKSRMVAHCQDGRMLVEVRIQTRRMI